MPTMPGRPAAAPPTLDDLRTEIGTMLGADPDSIPLDANLIQLGVDSLGLMRLANRWRRAGIKVSFRELVNEPTLEAWRRQLDITSE